MKKLFFKYSIKIKLSQRNDHWKIYDRLFKYESHDIYGETFTVVFVEGKITECYMSDDLISRGYTFDLVITMKVDKIYRYTYNDEGKFLNEKRPKPNSSSNKTFLLSVIITTKNKMNRSGYKIGGGNLDFIEAVEHDKYDDVHFILFMGSTNTENNAMSGLLPKVKLDLDVN